MQLELIDLMINAFSKQNFYVIGAGVSNVATYDEIGKSIIYQHKEIGIYSTTPSQQDEVFQRIFPSKFNIENDNNPDITTYSILLPPPPHRVHGIILQCLSPQTYQEPAYQYLVFSLFPTSVIFNLNIDGLAKKYCGRKHEVLNAHGNIPLGVHSEQFNLLIKDHYIGDMPTEAAKKIVYNVLQSLSWDLFIDNIGKHTSSIFDIMLSLSELSEIPFLPQREDHTITKRIAYRRAEISFPKMSHCIVIGYSFGRQANSIDDIWTFDFLTKMLRKYPKPVIIIDPKPENIAGIIQDAIKQKSVYPISAYWDLLARAIIESNGYYGLKTGAALYLNITNRYKNLRIERIDPKNTSS